jgi:hypothetical protein
LDLRKFAAADVAMPDAKSNVFYPFTTDEYGIVTIRAANHDN